MTTVFFRVSMRSCEEIEMCDKLLTQKRGGLSQNKLQLINACELDECNGAFSLELALDNSKQTLSRIGNGRVKCANIRS